MHEPTRVGRVIAPLTALALGAGAIAVAGDWSMFRGDPSLTGVADDELAETLEPQWVFEAGDAFESAAAVHDGEVYAGSVDAQLYALDLATGKQKWKY